MNDATLYALIEAGRSLLDSDILTYLKNHPDMPYQTAVCNMARSRCGDGPVREAYETKGRIGSIRVYRSMFNTGLWEAKDAVERLANEHKWKKFCYNQGE